MIKTTCNTARSKTPLLAAVLASLLFHSTSVLAADWPQFRGPTAQGRAPAAADLPTRWSSSQNIRWRTEIPGRGWSSPVIDDEVVYLTAAVPAGEADVSLRVLALDARTGRVLWNHEAFLERGQATRQVHDKNTHASPTPVLADDRIYVHFGHMGTACLTRDGQIVWRNNELRYQPVHGNGGSPILVDDKLVFSIDGTDQQFIVALHKDTGQIVWQTPRSISAARPFSFSTPLLIEHPQGQRQIISQASAAAYAYDPQTGAELWRVRYADGYSVVPRPVFGNGLLYLSTGFNNPDLLAIRPEGRGDITETHIAWSQRRGAPHTPSPLLIDQRIFLISDAGIASCLDASSGQVIWQHRVGGNFSASPIEAGGLIYMTSEEGVTTVIRAADAWEEIGRNDLGERALASPAAVGRALYLRTEKALYRIENP